MWKTIIIENFMYEFLEQNPIFAVLVIVLVCWAGISAYLFRMGSRVSRVEKLHTLEQGEKS
jgi:CcmD family protein